MNTNEYRICTNCIMDTSDPGIVFDEQGVCDHCGNFYKHIKPNWHPDERGLAELEKVADQIRRDGRGRDFDCIIGISGGVDSSYLTYLAKEKLGLRPLMYHVDAGWNSQEAVNNIERLMDALALDLHTEVVNWEEMKDLQRAFIKACVPYADTPQDLAFFSSMYNFTLKHDIKYILTGANYATECVRQPLEWAYYATDLRHIRDIHRRFGRIPLKTFPMASIFRYKIYDRFFKNIRVVKPLDFLVYDKDRAIEELEQKFGWQRYPHKHYESRCTRFIESYWMPEKFGADNRRAHFSSMVLSGQMSREEALARISKKAYDEATVAQDIEYFATKLDLSVEEFHDIMRQPNKSFGDYKNAKWAIDLGNWGMRMMGMQKVMIR